jgi:hypothetical protein
MEGNGQRWLICSVSTAPQIPLMRCDERPTKKLHSSEGTKGTDSRGGGEEEGSDDEFAVRSGRAQGPEGSSTFVGQKSGQGAGISCDGRGN